MQLKLVIIPSACKSVPSPQIIAHYFELLVERSEKFSSPETTTMWLIGLFASGPLQIRIPDYARAQILAMKNHWMQLLLYILILCEVFKMMITKLFFVWLIWKQFFPKNFKIEKFYAKITSLRVEAEAIQALRLPHPCFKNYNVIIFIGTLTSITLASLATPFQI